MAGDSISSPVTLNIPQHPQVRDSVLHRELTLVYNALRALQIGLGNVEGRVPGTVQQLVQQLVQPVQVISPASSPSSASQSTPAPPASPAPEKTSYTLGINDTTGGLIPKFLTTLIIKAGTYTVTATLGTATLTHRATLNIRTVSGVLYATLGVTGPPANTSTTLILATDTQLYFYLSTDDTVVEAFILGLQLTAI